MKRETESTLPKVEWLASSLADNFVQRRDCYARQFDDGSYVCIHKPLHQGLLISHLNGELTLGAYVLDQHNRARFAVLDADDDEQWQKLIRMSKVLSGDGIPSYLESSRRGGHLWLFFDRPIPGRESRRFGKKLLEMNDAVGIELFPKQDRLS